MKKEELKLLCEKYEHWETPEWAVKAILEKELLTLVVIDPCTGTGILANQARKAGYVVLALDIHDWGIIKGNFYQHDWLNGTDEKILGEIKNRTILMNPPFTLSEKFVDKAFELGARKIVCFQKLSWYEGSYDTGKKRGKWWSNHPPSRIWLCGDRANCWRHDVPQEERNSTTPTAYAWFVWEKGHNGTQLSHIYRTRE